MAKKTTSSTKRRSKKVVARAVPVRSRSRVSRFFAVLLPMGVFMLALTFAASMIWSAPLVASADTGDGCGCGQQENFAPEAFNQSLTTIEGVATSTVLTYADPEEGTVVLEISMEPAHGTLSGALPNITYTPNPGFVGTDEFDFTANDGMLEDIGTITITVTAAPTQEEPEQEEEEETPPAPESPASTSGGGGGGSGGGGVVIGDGPNSIGYINTNPQGSGGTVLGTSTQATSTAFMPEELPQGCGAYLTSYLRFGRENDKEQVIKLQTFLNKHIGVGIEVTGVFDEATLDAVNKFQLVHFESVLRPWVPFGLPNEKTPTGYVYKTTRHKINLIHCATLSEPFPQLP